MLVRPERLRRRATVERESTVPLKITFELSDSDLRHFRKLAKTAQDTAKKRSEKRIIESARTLLQEIEQASVPDFIRERLEQTRKFVEMLEDADWALTGENRQRILNALAYFNEPADLIPDSIPGIGYLDDAIMVELVVQELQHDIDAYDDFCQFRAELNKGRARKRAPEPADQSSLEQRRKQLHARMRRRRVNRRRTRRSSGRTSNPLGMSF